MFYARALCDSLPKLQINEPVLFIHMTIVPAVEDDRFILDKNRIDTKIKYGYTPETIRVS
jgi:hypothetical protein